MRFFLTAVIVCCFSLEAKQLKVEVSAPRAILINGETGRVLYEKEAHQQCFPASVTKVMTALYALEKGGDRLDEIVKVPADAVVAVPPQIKRDPNRKHPPHRLEYGGTHMWLKAGEEMSLRTLLYGMMLPSGNDAANAIGYHLSGSIPTFMGEVNEYLRKLGCTGTIMNNPHGLPHPEHKTTAADLALVARKAMQHPVFREVVKSAKYPRPKTNLQEEGMLMQHNALVKPGRFYYPKAIGVKIGYTNASGFTLVAAAEDQGRMLIGVVMGCEKSEHGFQDAIALFDAAFAETEVSRTLFANRSDSFKTEVEGAKAMLQARLGEDLKLTYFPSEEPEFTTEVKWNVGTLPIEERAVVGEVRVLDESGRVLRASPLYAEERLEATFSHRVMRGLSGTKNWIGATVGLFLLATSFYQYHYRKPARRRKSTQARKGSRVWPQEKGPKRREPG